MASDMFIKIGDIKGESQDDKYKGSDGWINIMSFSWGISNSSDTHTGGGGGVGKASFSDLSVMKSVDLASPKLALLCANGKHIADSFLVVRKQGEKPLEYYKIKMSEGLISSFQHSGSDGGGLPTESISLNFAKIEFDYKMQNPDGSAGSGDEFKWDIAKNVKV